MFSKSGKRWKLSSYRSLSSKDSEDEIPQLGKHNATLVGFRIMESSHLLLIDLLLILQRRGDGDKAPFICSFLSSRHFFWVGSDSTQQVQFPQIQRRDLDDLKFPHLFYIIGTARNQL
ncbi:hypothetical protein Fcan01_17979 [Folsomia candida]|uniref:Uncharacterized protein n=1 Tax=Folsomia candida TaxID=158441 RepID=A0A226DRN1_FOLCA|nr:hypothetical protein Fcan01_17979 [Folsomia candida]